MERLTSRQTIKNADGSEKVITYCHGHRYGPAAFPQKYGTSYPEEYKNYCEMVDRIADYEDTGLEPEEITDIFSVISESQDDVDEDGISVGLLNDLLELMQYRKTRLTPEEILNHEEMFAAYRHVCGEKSPEEIQQVQSDLDFWHREAIKATAELGEKKIASTGKSCSALWKSIKGALEGADINA